MVKKLAQALLILFIIGLLLPATALIPVKGATCQDWNSKTFWFEPWGSSGVHKGIDIFAKQGTTVLAATSGFVLYSGEFSKGGKVILTLGPKWRLHYYAHMDTISTPLSFWHRKGEKIATVGSTGNAFGKPAHLHYSVLSLIPYPWLFSQQTQGWKKVFYLDPESQFEVCER